jgi:DNA-binding transcriptional LysR family regulator
MLGCSVEPAHHLQEFNSVEAIKSAVQYGLGAAFISSAAISKEMDLGLFKRLDISGVRLMRTLSLVSVTWPPLSRQFSLFEVSQRS